MYVCVLQELYGCYRFVPEGEGTRVTYKLRVEPGFPLPNMVKQATNKAICSTGVSLVRLSIPSMSLYVHTNVHVFIFGMHEIYLPARYSSTPSPSPAHTAALGELRSYTENPKTLARLRGDSNKSGAGKKKLYEDALEACLTSIHLH